MNVSDKTQQCCLNCLRIHLQLRSTKAIRKRHANISCRTRHVATMYNVLSQSGHDDHLTTAGNFVQQNDTVRTKARATDCTRSMRRRF